MQWRFAIWLGLILSFTALAATQGIAVTDARIPAAPPGAGMLAAYFTLKNDTPKTLTLIGASSPRFAHAYIHRSETTDGMAHMHPVERLEIAPGASVSFEPGGYHLMLMAPKSPVRTGEEISLTLRFASHAPVTISAHVVSE